MALTATLYRFQIDLSDVDRGVYEALDLRVAMHPSEILPFLLTRILAYALNYERGLEFTPAGLSDPDQPCLRSMSGKGGLDLWIEVGNPSAKKLHKASKAAERVKVYTYKDAALLVRDIQSNNVHNSQEIEIFAFAPEFLSRLGERLEKVNRWSILHTEGSLTIGIGESAEQGEVQRFHLAGGA